MSFPSASTSTRSNLSTIMLDSSFPTSNKKSGLQRVPSDRGAQSIPLFGIDSKGKINLWSEKTEELTGYVMSEAIGQDIHSLFHGENYIYADYLMKALNNEEVFDLLLPFHTSYSTCIFLTSSFRARKNAFESVNGAVCEAFEEPSGRIISFQNCEDDLCDVSSQSQLSYSVNTRRPIRCKPVVTRAQELAFLKVFIHRANAKVFGVSRDFKIDFWDEKIADLTSIPPEFAVGAPVTSIFSEEEYSVDLLPIIRDGINGVGSSHQQITYSSQDGIDTLLLVSVTPRMTEDVKAGVLVVAWNVTSLSDKELGRLIEAEDLCANEVMAVSGEIDRLTYALAVMEAKYEGQKRRAAAEAASVLEMKRNFVRGVSHEIRTPLNIVVSGLELIDTQMYKEISPEVRSLIKQIKSSCRDGVDILDDFLAYEKMDGELTVIEKTELLVSDLVKQCLSPFTLQAKLKNIRLQYSETDYTDPCGKAFLPIIKIEVDNFKIRQVLRNLISNAVKFTPSGGTITCNVKLKDESVDPDIVCDKGIVRIEIIDTGVGLSPENQSKLFKEIIQFDAKTLQGGGGSGLGLWLTKGLVALNGGTVGVFSEGTGKGTTFYVEFPVSEVKFSQLGEKNRVYSSFELADTTTNSTHNLDLKQRGVDGWKDLRLLVVDDSMMSRKMVVRLLSPKFRDVVEVADGQEAVDQVIHAIEINTPFDVVLMDSQMPRMSGLEAAKELRRLGFTGAIMGLTGNGGTEDVREFMDQGADHVFLKPFDTSRLLEKTAEVLNKRAQALLKEEAAKLCNFE